MQSQHSTGRAQRPDLIISDILMPEMDGFILCQAVKGMADLRNRPFVFHTATYTDPADERLGLSLGASAYIQKPMEPPEFLQRIDDILQSWKKQELPVINQVTRSQAEIGAMHHDRV